MMKVNCAQPQRSIGDGVPGSSSKPASGSCSISSDVSSHNDNDDHWQHSCHSDDNDNDNDNDNSSHGSSSWSSSTHPHRSRSASSSSQYSGRESKPKHRTSKTPLPPPVLVYHENARSIVFRDSVHVATPTTTITAAAQDEVPNILSDSANGEQLPFPSECPSDSTTEHPEYLPRSFEDEKEMKVDDLHDDGFEPLVLDSVIHDTNSYSVDIKGFQPQVVPLPRLQLGRNDEFEPLIVSNESQQEEYWTEAEKEVYHMLMDQRATVKTIQNTEWTSFLKRFKTTRPPPHGEDYRNQRDDIAPHHGCDDNDNDNDDPDNKRACGDFPYNCFFTSTTLLPSGGMKMRVYGTTSNYTTGCVFALPSFEDDPSEDEAAKSTKTWSWPSGYSAKTEFNIDERGNLINGREEALVPLSGLRRMNNDYVTKSDYHVGGRLVKGGLKTVPYNEVFLRVGGRGRTTANGRLLSNEERSFDHGVGLPVALFCRTASFGHLFSLLRTRARLLHTFGEQHMKGMPLLMITSDQTVRVLTETLQHELLKVAARQLNPFQNSLIAHKTKITDTDPDCMQTKLEELIDLDDRMQETLTTEELARIAGGFGATDESVARILRNAMVQDKQRGNGEGCKERHELQDIVNEGLAASVRASDYYTSRQLLILYSLVSSEDHQIDTPKTITNGEEKSSAPNDEDGVEEPKRQLNSGAMLVKCDGKDTAMALNSTRQGVASRPPPPPLDTDRLRSATNSDGLLAVLGAAQILKAMQDGGAKRRTKESWEAVEEWVEQGERNIAFRLASWRNQRAAQDDLEIAVDQDSRFMAFVSGKAISNRKTFAQQLHQAVENTDFSDIRFLLAIDEIVNRMHSPCLRLELLQYVLGLDNRYSVEHVKRAVELAATCLNISSTSDH